MGTVRVYASDRGCKFWELVRKKIRERGYHVEKEIKDADLSIVISGKFINPLVLTGKKVLVYDTMEWIRNVPNNGGWLLYKTVLDEYYDDFIDVSDCSAEEKANRIVNYIEGEECTKVVR